MATQHYTFTGTCKWAKVWPGQIDRKFQTDQRGGNWSIIVNLSDSEAKRYNALGMKGKAASETDVAIAQLKAKAKGKESTLSVGDVTFRRYEKHPVLGDLGAPKVSGVDQDQAIGNDSTVTVSLEVYPYTFEGTVGRAGRLAAVKVVDLVEYDKPEVNPVKDLDDTIPF